jgi:antitoxin VapB
MPLYIKDDTTAQLVGELAKLRGTSKQDAVRHAVTAELGRLRQDSLLERLQALRDRLGPLKPTGLLADKAFFDELSGEP